MLSHSSPAFTKPKLPAVSESPRLPGLDGLRALACLMVFSVHFGQATQPFGHIGPFDLARLLENGNSGVALFFVLSGFLLSLPYWQTIDARTPAPATGTYLLRRAARIVPAYYFCVTALIIANRLWTEDYWIRDTLLHYSFTFNLFDATLFSINPPFWTVAVEVQFYLLLPLVFLVLRRFPFSGAPLLLALLCASIYFANWALNEHTASAASTADTAPSALAYSILAHMPHFLFGVLTGWLFVLRRFTPWRRSHVINPKKEFGLWMALLLLFVVLGTPIDDYLQFPYGRYNFPYVPLLLAVIVLLTPLTATGAVLFDNPAMRSIGSISYGVYLFHLPALHVVGRTLEKYGYSVRNDWLLFGVVSLALTVLIAMLSYRVIEKPALRLVRRS